MRKPGPLLLSLSLGLLLAGCREPDPVIHQADGVRVTLREVRNPERQYSTYQTRVEAGQLVACWSNGPFGIGRAAARQELGQVLAVDRYLFVPASCGGGNASKCRGYQAFSLGEPVAWLGNITGRWDGQNVVPYADGEFYDTGDWLEINDLVPHAHSPRYAVAYRHLEGGLRFDADRTWALNAAAYRAAPDDAPGLLYKAGLARLCGRLAEQRAVQARADRVLNQQGRRLFDSSLAKVPIRGVGPSAFIPVGPCPEGGEG